MLATLPLFKAFLPVLREEETTTSSMAVSLKVVSPGHNNVKPIINKNIKPPFLSLRTPLPYSFGTTTASTFQVKGQGGSIKLNKNLFAL
jgi:hypothetical protein